MESGYVRKFSQRAKCDLRSCKKCIPREFPELSLLLIYICHTSCYSIIVILLLYTRLYLYSMHIHINIHHHQMHFVPVCFFFSSCCVRLLLSLSISHRTKGLYLSQKPHFIPKSHFIPVCFFFFLLCPPPPPLSLSISHNKGEKHNITTLILQLHAFF